jgi:DtxR family Mn-dependent transcriptional regulator
MSVQHEMNLVYMPFNRQAEISSVRIQSTELLELLKHKNIHIGTKLEVKKRFDFDNSIEVKVKNFSPVTISEQLAKALYVKPMTS